MKVVVVEGDGDGDEACDPPTERMGAGAIGLERNRDLRWGRGGPRFLFDEATQRLKGWGVPLFKVHFELSGS